jgi:ribosome-binding factor A
MTRRTERIGNLIQKELGDLIHRELTDARIGFVTISRVDITTDLAHAKVYISTMGSDKEKRDSLAGLSRSASFLRTQLAKVFHMRTVPRLQFLEDKNLDHGFRINELLKDIQSSDKQAPPPEDD